LCGLGAACGAAIPPLGPCLRTLWATVVGEEKLRQTAFALDAVLIETAFIVGPLGTALVVSAASPAAAVLANAALGGTGTVVFALIDEIVAPGTATEATSWITMALITGVAIGSGVGGAVVGGGNADVGYLLAAGAALTAALIAASSRRGWLAVA